MTATPSETQDRTPLSRDRIVRAAIDLADTDGISGLSMRKLGSKLGVEAMSLYNHVDNKDDLIAAMIDAVLGEVDPPDPAGDWKDELRASSRSAHDVFVQHAWITNHIMEPIAGTPNRFRNMEAVLATLRMNGFSVALTHHAFHALETHTIGYTMQQVTFDFDEEEIQTAGTEFLKTLAVDQYPYLAEHVGHHLNPGDDDLPAFEFGLNLILDGIERLRDA